MFQFGLRDWDVLLGYSTGEELSPLSQMLGAGWLQQASKERPVGLASIVLRRNILEHEIRRKPKVVRVRAYNLLSKVGLSMPTPGPDWLTAAFGVLQRACRPSPVMNIDLMVEFSKFVMNFLPVALREVKLEIDYEFDARRWIESMDKPRTWKDSLIRLLDDNDLWDYMSASLYPSTLDGKERMEAELYSIFQKDESYEKVTATRIIFALTDYHRVVFGDVCKTIGDQLVHNANTFSGVPVDRWPELLSSIFNVPGKPAHATDFSGFEKWFNIFVKHTVDYVPFAVVAAHHPEASARLELMRKMEVNCSIFRHACFQFRANDTFQQSGSHKTYSVNTFGHWLLSCFFHTIAHGKYPTVHPKIGVKNAADIDIHLDPRVLSGDDSKTASYPRMQVFLYEALGLGVEFEPGIEDDDLAFCKVKVAWRSDGSICKVPPFWELLAKLPWCPKQLAGSKYSKLIAMTKAKALSYLHLYPTTPILSKICSEYIHHFRSIDVTCALKHFDAWSRDKIRAAIEHVDKSIVAKARNARIDPLELEALSRASGISPGAIARIHRNIKFGFDGSCSALDELSIYAEQAVPHWIINSQIYSTKRSAVSAWAEPGGREARLDVLKQVLLCSKSEASVRSSRYLDAARLYI